MQANNALIYSSTFCVREYLKELQDQSILLHQVGSLAGSGEGIITSESVWGLLRGLETFSQLLVPEASAYTIRSTEIRDFPRFTYRCVLRNASRSDVCEGNLIQQ